MAIPVNCPSCGFEGEASETTVGQTVLCPDCRYNIPVPDLNSKPTSSHFREQPPPERKNRRPEIDVREEDDYDDRPVRRRNRRSSLRYASTCKECGSDAPPIHRSQISVAGWIVFVVMLLLCWPLCFIGLFIKDEYSVCGECGARI
ncbi:MAG: LITAF-like zinc ribbon domain-containing protein [Gemmataceae bacterium]